MNLKTNRFLVKITARALWLEIKSLQKCSRGIVEFQTKKKKKSYAFVRQVNK